MANANPEVVGNVALQALNLAMTASAALGPSGIPMVLLFGSSAGLINLFTPSYEPPLTLTQADFERAMSEIATRISDDNARQSATLAAGDIRTAYVWYERYNARVAGGEQFSQMDLDELRVAVQAGLGPNSLLVRGLSILSNVDVGKFDCVTYALGASLFAKLGLMDIGVQANRGEKIAASQWSWLATKVADMATCLQSLAGAGDLYGLAKLNEWASQHPGYKQQDFIAQRDRLTKDLFGGADARGRVNLTYIELRKGAQNYAELAQKAG